MAYDVDFRRGYDGAWLYVPRSESPCPGLVVLHGSDGGRAGWSQWTALLLASSGFCTIAPDYSVGGNAWHAGDIHEVELDRTEATILWLRGCGLTSGRVGLFGTSRGAEHALLVTALMARDGSAGRPDAVAVHSPTDTIAGAFQSGLFDPSGAETWDPAKRAWRWRGASDDLLPTTPIEIERYRGPLFLSHGEADRVWTVEGTRRLEARLRAAGLDPEVRYYPDEGHALQPEAFTLQHQRLTAFFRKHLSAA